MTASTRRAAIGAILSAPLASAPADASTLGPHPDAILFRLEREWLAARAAEDASYERQQALDVFPDGPARGLEDPEAWSAWRKASGLDAAEEESRRRCRETFALSDRIAETSATTLAGIAVKARVVLYHDSLQLDPSADLVVGIARDLLALEGGPCA